MDEKKELASIVSAATDNLRLLAAFGVSEIPSVRTPSSAAAGPQAAEKAVAFEETPRLNSALPASAGVEVIGDHGAPALVLCSSGDGPEWDYLQTIMEGIGLKEGERRIVVVRAGPGTDAPSGCKEALASYMKKHPPKAAVAFGQEAARAAGAPDVQGRFSTVMGVRLMVTHGISEILRDKLDGEGRLRGEAWEHLKGFLKALGKKPSGKKGA